MLDTLTDQDWAALRAERYAPRDPNQGDLLSMMTGIATSSASPPSPQPEPAVPPSFVDAGEDYL